MQVILLLFRFAYAFGDLLNLVQRNPMAIDMFS